MQMQQVTIGTKYQIVIPKQVRMQDKDLRPGAKVMVGRTKEGVITVKATRKNWSDESYGFMKEAWKNIDPATEIDKMRNEWDEKKK